MWKRQIILKSLLTTSWLMLKNITSKACGFCFWFSPWQINKILKNTLITAYLISCKVSISKKNKNTKYTKGVGSPLKPRTGVDFKRRLIFFLFWWTSLLHHLDSYLSSIAAARRAVKRIQVPVLNTVLSACKECRGLTCSNYEQIFQSDRCKLPLKYEA